MDIRNVSIASAIVFIFWLCLQANAALALESPAAKPYENAFKLIVEGDYGEAYRQLGEIIAMYPGTTYARFAEARRRQLEKLDMPDARLQKVDQSGRIESVIFGSLYSAWLGVGAARLANADSAKAAAAGMMIGIPVGLLTSLALTKNARLSDGQAALINSSAYWGTWQGYGMAILLDKNDDEKTMIGGAMSGGLLCMFAASALTRKIDLSPGDASLINYGGLWGTWLTFMGGLAAELADSDNLLALTLIGGDLGAAAMAGAATKLEFSFTQASLINLSGILGTVVAGGLLLILQPEDARTVPLTLMAGGALGLASGYEIFGRRSVVKSLQGLGFRRPHWAMAAGSREARTSLLGIEF